MIEAVAGGFADAFICAYEAHCACETPPLVAVADGAGTADGDGLEATWVAVAVAPGDALATVVGDELATVVGDELATEVGVALAPVVGDDVAPEAVDVGLAATVVAEDVADGVAVG